MDSHMGFQLFEYFNTTNQMSPHYEMHINFAKPVAEERCEKITILEPKDRCDFASHNPVCEKHGLLINYNKYFYCLCDGNDLFHVVCIGILMLMCSLFFWILYITTTNYFVPALQGISKRLNLNEYIAGIAIMAFGNNAPDIISCITGISSESRHIYTDSMSVNLFVSVFAPSLIMWLKPFAVDGVFFLRDVGFLLLYVSYVDFVYKIRAGYIDIFGAASMVGVGFIYILLVVCDEYLQYRKNKAWKAKEHTSEEVITFDNQKFPFMKEYGMTFNLGISYQTSNRQLFRQFFEVFDTLDRNMFNSKWTIFKLWALVKVPATICLRLLIPQLNFVNSEYKWSKLLCCIQIVLTPLLLVLFYTSEKYFKVMTYFIPIWTIPLLILTPLSVLAFRTSRTDTVPIWYPYVTILCIVSSIFVVYVVSLEVTAILETLGITLGRSSTFIGCTLYTWGTGMNDLMANLDMARKGYPRMAFSACLGGGLFSLLTSLAIPILYLTIESDTGSINVTEGTAGETTSIIIIISLLMILLYGVSTNFLLHRTGGLIGLTLYTLFLFFSVSSEFEIIHAFGTDHALDRSFFDENYKDVA